MGTKETEIVALQTYQTVQAIYTYIKVREKMADQREQLIKTMNDQYIKDKKFLKSIIIVLIVLLCMFAGLQGYKIFTGL
jgi:hypothetical protein